MNIGYGKKLIMLAFDHRGSLSKHLLGIAGEPDAEQAEQMKRFKWVIYQGFEMAVAAGIPKEDAAILTDEQYGSAVLQDAKTKGYTFCAGVEKSGQKEFAFEFGEDFAAHIEKFGPPIVKALVRYNPEDDAAMNARQLENLKKLSDYCHSQGRKLLVEPLIGATDAELADFGGDAQRYDQELRPKLEVAMIRQFQEAGVEVDIWKIEGMTKPEHYEAAVAQARAHGRDHVGVVILGRGEDAAHVETWLRAGRSVSGVIGFAIGRTIFWQPLEGLRDGKITEEQASAQIANNYMHFYEVFSEK